MATTVLQIRVDEDTREQAAMLFENLGLDLPTAVRIFLKKSIATAGLPFDVREEAQHDDLQLTDDEKIDVAAKRILERYRPAFEELAK